MDIDKTGVAGDYEYELNQTELDALTPGKKAIIWIGQSVEHCFPGPMSWAGYASFYLTLAQQQPELAAYILSDMFDLPEDNDAKQLVQDAVDTLVTHSKEWFR